MRFFALHFAKRTFALTTTSVRRIPTATTTRWSSNSKLVSVIVNDWQKLKESFEIIIDCSESDQKSIHLARGYLSEMNDFTLKFLAVVSNDIFNCTDVLFEILQTKSLDCNFCVSSIKKTLDAEQNIEISSLKFILMEMNLRFGENEYLQFVSLADTSLFGKLNCAFQQLRMIIYKR